MQVSLDDERIYIGLFTYHHVHPPFFVFTLIMQLFKVGAITFLNSFKDHSILELLKSIFYVI